jgi:murein L,D-transpeptidase YcbB/YkuD
MALRAGVRVLPLALASALLVVPVAARGGDDEPRVDAVALLGGPARDAAPRAAELLRFYQSRDYRPAWTRGDRLSRQGAALLRVLREAGREGLTPDRYAHPLFDTAAHADDASIGEIDLRLTDALLRYAADAGQGRFDPAGTNPYWAQRTPAVDAGAVLRQALESRDVARTLGGLLPRNPQYSALREALARYRAIAAKGGWPAVPATRRPLAQGQRTPGVAALRARLLAEGDLRGSAAAARADLFDAPLAAALKRFQLRHGLDPSGAVDRPTAAALSVPVEERVLQIELNLERWRWLAPSLQGADRFVLVNIPAFVLHGFAHGRSALRMRVVTGNASRSPTPVFGRTMTHVVFRPYWNVPTSIAQDEILPAVSRDRGYLRRRNMELVRGDGGLQLRQRPGPGNALGLVKFLLPNPFGIYLHDTPEDALFARARRDRSHGCVRVERPFDLARFALAGAPEWTPARMRAAAARGPEQPVALPDPLPVFITYLTAWADADGVRFFPDVYEHDAQQLRELQ